MHDRVGTESYRIDCPKSPRQIDAELAELATMLKNVQSDSDLDAVIEIAKKRRLGQP